MHIGLFTDALTEYDLNDLLETCRTLGDKRGRARLRKLVERATYSSGGIIDS